MLWRFLQSNFFFHGRCCKFFMSWLKLHTTPKEKRILCSAQKQEFHGEFFWHAYVCERVAHDMNFFWFFFFYVVFLIAPFSLTLGGNSFAATCIHTRHIHDFLLFDGLNLERVFDKRVIILCVCCWCARSIWCLLIGAIDGVEGRNKKEKKMKSEKNI